MRASYALPGVFEPVRIGGRWLFDGAIVNPVPVNVARAMGADRVIALAIGGDGSSRGATLHAPADLGLDPPKAPEVETRPGMMDSLRRRGLWMKRAWSSEEEGAPGLATVMVNTFNITQDRIMRSRLAGDPPDFLVTLKAGKIGLFEWCRRTIGRRCGQGDRTLTRAVPFVMAGSGITGRGQASYDEVVAAASDVSFEKGHELMRRFLG